MRIVCTVGAVDRHHVELFVPSAFESEDTGMPGRIKNPTELVRWPRSSLPNDVAVGDRFHFVIAKIPNSTKEPL